MKLSILGTDYDLIVRKYSEDKSFEESRIDGYCDSWSKEIVVCDMTTHPNFEGEPENTCKSAQMETTRHEIVHAFLDESGLGCSSFRCENRGWSKNEEMVDWIALQGPKLYRVWVEAGVV